MLRRTSCSLIAFVKEREKRTNSKMERHLVPEWRWMKPLSTWQQSCSWTGWKIKYAKEGSKKCSAHIRGSQVTLFTRKCSRIRCKEWRHAISTRYTTHYSQPLDRSFLKSLKTFGTHSNIGQKTKRLQNGKFLHGIGLLQLEMINCLAT